MSKVKIESKPSNKRDRFTQPINNIKMFTKALCLSAPLLIPTLLACTPSEPNSSIATATQAQSLNPTAGVSQSPQASLKTATNIEVPIPSVVETNLKANSVDVRLFSRPDVNRPDVLDPRILGHMAIVRMASMGINTLCTVTHIGDYLSSKGLKFQFKNSFNNDTSYFPPNTPSQFRAVTSTPYAVKPITDPFLIQQFSIAKKDQVICAKDLNSVLKPIQSSPALELTPFIQNGELVYLTNLNSKTVAYTVEGSSGSGNAIVISGTPEENVGPGNSGEPVLDKDGKLVGLVSLGMNKAPTDSRSHVVIMSLSSISFVP